LRMAQLMPLPVAVSCFSKNQIGFSFLVPAHPGSPRQRAVKRECVLCYKGPVAPYSVYFYRQLTECCHHDSDGSHNRSASGSVGRWVS